MHTSGWSNANRSIIFPLNARAKKRSNRLKVILYKYHRCILGLRSRVKSCMNMLGQANQLIVLGGVGEFFLSSTCIRMTNNIVSVLKSFVPREPISERFVLTSGKRLVIPPICQNSSVREQALLQKRIR